MIFFKYAPRKIKKRIISKLSLAPNCREREREWVSNKLKKR